MRAAPTPPAAPPTSCENGGAGALARARGQLTVRADSGFYTHAVVAVCRRMDVLLDHYPPAPKPAQSHRGDTRGGLDAIPRRRADVAETTYTPFQSEPDATPRLIVRRVGGSQLALLPPTITVHRPGWGDGRPIMPRRDRERHPRPEVRRRASPLGALRRQRRLAGRPGDGA